jgi:hypothetical protein
VKYQEFPYNQKIDGHKISTPVFVPIDRLQQRMDLLRKLKELSISTNTAINYKNTKLSGNEYEDRLEITDFASSDDYKLDLKTMIFTNLSPNKTETLRRKYLEFAGKYAEDWILEPYQPPLSRNSVQNGIYFSAQDCLSMELRLKDKLGATAASAGFQAPSQVHFCPQYLYLVPIVKKARSQLEVKLAEYAISANFFSENSPLFPKETFGQLKNTKIAVAMMEKLAEGYAHCCLGLNNN